MAAYDDFAGLGAVRPRLRQDAVFLRSDGGAYLRSNETAFFLRGQRAYRWVSTLGPYLTGEHTVVELCDGLGPDHRDTVLGVVGALLERGFAVDVPPVDSGVLDAQILARFARQLAYLQHATGPASHDRADDTAFDRAAAGLAAVRAATVHVVGSGAMARSAALALVRNGVGTVDLLAVDDPATHRAELAAAVAELAAAGVESAAGVHAYGVEPSERPDVVVHLAGPGELSTLPVNRAGAPVVPVVVGGGTAVLGPVTRPGAAPCWLCAQLRLAATGDPAAAADLWRELALGVPVRPRGGALSVVVAGMLGTAAAFEAFRLLAGLPVDLDGAVVQDTETLESRRQRLFAHPMCPACRTVAPAAAETVSAAAETTTTTDDTDEERYERLSVLVGDRLGVFGRFTDDALTQAPLKVAGIAVTSPAARSGGRRELLAFDDVSVLRARITVIGAAVLDYVGQLPDRPDVVTGDAEALAGHRLVRPSALATASGAASDVRRWVPARSLRDGATVLVPLAAVYPMSAANADRVVEPAPVGAAVGRDLDELAAAGLTAAVAHRAVRDALHGRGVLCRLDEDATTAADEVLALLKGLRHLGRPVAVHDLPGAAPAHAVLATTDHPDGAPLLAIGHGMDQPTAVAGALRELLGRLQVHGDHDRTADLGDPLLPDLDPRTALPMVDAAPEPRPATDAAGVVAALSAAGWDALLVETTTADVRAAGALVAGVVLLAQDGGRPEGTRTEEGG